MTETSNRATVFEQQAKILSHQALPEEQYLLRLHAPECAAHAVAGSFIHLQCQHDRDDQLRRPLSLMRTDAQAGWIEVLYKVVGQGTLRLSRQKTGDKLACLGPIGQGFKLHDNKPRRLLIGGGVGIPPMIFLADTLRKRRETAATLVIMGSEIPFPFKTQPANSVISGMPAEAIASMALLDDWQIASRLCSQQNYPGCYQGFVTDLARLWLSKLDAAVLEEIEIFSCGPHPMLKAVAGLAQEFGLACQVSLEEFMACAIGGCAGCAVQITTPTGYAMKRVCVDGPVFDVYQLDQLTATANTR